MGYFSFRISLSLSGIAMYTHRPQGVIIVGILHVLKYFFIISYYT